YGHSAERIADTARQLRAATDRPFALNLWIPTGDEAEPGDVDLSLALRAVAPLYEELGIEAPTGTPDRFLPTIEEQLDAVLAARPAVLSCVFGMPPATVVSEAQARGIRV